MRRPALSVLLLLTAACATQATDTQQLAISHAARARDIELATPPSIRQQSREEFAADAQKEADAETDDDIQRQRDAYGRLGFYPRDFDVRAAGGASSALYIAYYSSETKAVTVVGEPDHSTLVHELVHALQDQKFDLRRVHGEHLSSDESLARSALVEGDARMAEYRDLLFDRGQDPIPVLQEYVTTKSAYEDAVDVFSSTKLPLLYASHAAFAYSFGSAFVAARLGLPSGRWRYAAVDALFAAGDGPKSTQDVIRAGKGAEPDPILPTGLSTLPAAVAADWSVEGVDRMGEWYTYVLLYPATYDKTGLAYLTATWDGDQLLTLRKKDGSTPPSVSSPSGIVWTTIWADAESARQFANALSELQHLHARGGTGTNPMVSLLDQEEVWLERRDRQVCFVKNLPRETAEPLAHAALYTAAERRFEILRLAPSKPLIVH